MISSIPAEVQDSLKESLGALVSFTPASGGCINHGGRIEAKSGEVFVKWNDAERYPGMFESESRGLELLAQQKCVRVPSVVRYGIAGRYQFILMEFIRQTKHAATGYWQELGESLASLHQVTSSHFGLDHDNYIGSLHQTNSGYNHWSEFFVRQRIEPQLKLLRPDVRMRRQFDSLFLKLDNIFPDEKPALLHGDLWGGNLICDERGRPCLIDPAVYFGHREMELAFTRLFGGFDIAFYDTYKAVFPLKEGHRERVEICNLYPLLVHANLFGGQYLHEIQDILSHWA